MDRSTLLVTLAGKIGPKRYLYYDTCTPNMYYSVNVALYPQLPANYVYT